ncbi:thiol reductant ABC exporter subunit CydC [Acetobacter sp.]|jgi:ATP-binding cassette subfamily C protein CydC|uniref:thiol reductant ABC exporter subunit CydC n=1 Tax=Acetobacter sp. TaxID=440 RepID=UPI0025C64647|nr:thiol reductant ABC exporter subunit CydC [Acetobacter sp.]MCH4091987.1 thiol reductant ABC exporter subunit CydC [Acetobacter sp.]MCI1301093.1 thiol reductant ABC exporter subunit CydC [Acetobacter sp.]MCI1317286.1 thiol reductant ABC exporter subunit CydC [Acetobacter sp.]
MKQAFSLPPRSTERQMLLGLVLASVAALANFGLLFLSGWLLASAAVAGLAGLAARDAFNMFLPAAGVRFLATLRILARYGERVVTHDVSLRRIGQVRTWSFGRLVALPPRLLARQRSGEQLFHFVTDTERAGNAWLDVRVPRVTAAVCGVTCVALTTFFVPQAGIVLALGLLLSGLILPMVTGWLSDRATARIAAHQDAMHGDLVEVLQSLDEITFLGAGDVLLQRLDIRQAAVRQARMQLAMIEGAARALVGVLAMLTAVGVLACAATAREGGFLSAACLPMLALGALAAFENMAPLSAARQMARQAHLAEQRIMTLCAPVPDAVTDERQALPQAPFDLELSDLGMCYGPGEGWVLRHADLTIRQGERVALVGPSGSGKSTLINLLFQFNEYQEGVMRFGGVDVSRLNADALSRTVGVLSQDAHLFQGSIRRNLAMACPEADEAAMWTALETAQLASFVRQTPEGLDTLVGEAGLRLSGGQRRRLALACVLLRRPCWLILDEPTEGLDAATEQALMTALTDALPPDTTLLCITHREPVLPFLDRTVEIVNRQFRENTTDRGRPR